jgi:hypothetical protein
MLPDGTPTRAPVELQLGWLMERWGIEVLGPEPDFKLIIKADRALAVHRAFKKAIKDRTEADWKIISDALKVIEG